MKRMLFLLAAAGCCMGARAEPIGRLFFTPEQRILFDLEYRSAMAPSPHDRIRLDGTVLHGEAGRTCWINGRPFSPVPALGRIGGLRVGETIDTRTRHTTDIVPDGSIAPRR